MDAPQPRKRGRPAGTKNKNNLKVASTTTGTAPLAPPAVTTVQSIPDAEVLFDVLIRVMMPDKTVKTGRGKAPKVQKVDPIPFGPIELPLSVTWLQLLDAIVDIIDGCEDRQQLVISSFVWRFPTPANALRSGLKNEGNLASLVKQLRLLKPAVQKFIVLEMSPLLKMVKPQDYVSRRLEFAIFSNHRDWSFTGLEW